MTVLSSRVLKFMPVQLYPSKVEVYDSTDLELVDLPRVSSMIPWYGADPFDYSHAMPSIAAISHVYMHSLAHRPRPGSPPSSHSSFQPTDTKS